MRRLSLPIRHAGLHYLISRARSATSHQMDLFSHAQIENPSTQPLPEALRPRKLEDMLGQTKILGPNTPWRKLLESGQIPSLILWGPPGTGKTTFALLLSQKVNAEFITVNAIETGAKALRELGDEGRRRRLERNRRTLLFVDEIHRLNKGQQDVLLPYMEKGDLILVGATTENPSYEINSALLSRARILVFERLKERDIMELASRAAQTRGLKLEQLLTPDALNRLVEVTDGDARRLLNAMEILLNLHAAHALNPETPESESSSADTDQSAERDDKFEAENADGERDLQNKSQRQANSGGEQSSEFQLSEDTQEGAHPNISDHESEAEGEAGRYDWPLGPEGLSQVFDAPTLRYDKSADEHYDVVSAFIKSVRGSDPDAAMYYLARMIKGGEDPVFIARRLVILASEDIGNADPRAITLAVSGLQAVELVGWPEAAISLAQVTTYLASAPKSNRSYMALKNAQELVERTGTVPIPLALRSSKTSVMKQMGYGKGYKYSHDSEKGFVSQRFLPQELGDPKIYEPTDHGFEKNIRQYLAWLRS